MINYTMHDGYCEVHLDIDKWTAATHRQFIKETKVLAEKEGWPLVFAAVPKDKCRFMEHLGLTWVRTRMTENGLEYIYCVQTEIYRNA